jgi:hypothetical protein
MRGRRSAQSTMLALVDLEERVPAHHPLRTIKRFADRALAELSPTFDAMYRTGGRPSIPPPERLLKASLLISPYSVRSERAFCEEQDVLVPSEAVLVQRVRLAQFLLDRADGGAAVGRARERFVRCVAYDRLTRFDHQWTDRWRQEYGRPGARR